MHEHNEPPLGHWHVAQIQSKHNTCSTVYAYKIIPCEAAEKGPGQSPWYISAQKRCLRTFLVFFRRLLSLKLSR